MLRELQEFPEHPQVIVMTGFQEVSTAVEAMKLGAYDYLTKPTQDRGARHPRAQGGREGPAPARQRRPAGPRPGRRTVRRASSPRSQRMEEVLRIVDRVAPTDVLRARCSARAAPARSWWRGPSTSARRARERPFVPINCGALPREVLESELFGHEKGAFTGAVGAKPGLFELADGGTLFLDEIGEMAPDSQVKLLRVLETGMFFRVGGTRPRRGGRAAGGRHQPRPGRGDARRGSSARTSTTGSTRSP